MRIIGGRDYYDGAGYGVDRSTVFVRKPRTDLTSPLQIRSHEIDNHYVDRFEVVVAGQLYVGLHARKKSDYFTPPSTSKFFYDQAQVNEFFTKPNYYNRDILDLSVSQARQVAIRTWALDNRVTIAIAGGETHEITEFYSRGYVLFAHSRQKKPTLIDSDALKDIEFYRALNPHDTYQAISSWVGGVLPFNTPTVELSNRSRIVKAGFDLRTSFRKAKI